MRFIQGVLARNNARTSGVLARTSVEVPGAEVPSPMVAGGSKGEANTVSHLRTCSRGVGHGVSNPWP